ncbi:type II toxin-antitoxin system antitoxin DNA ADP-ribosyl glycohydrolase DarG [Noviherbaspirillum sp. Root189]|uniref:type II toxin-antitoxin system antitoxin DNA ADP-ribosyl glycohydrolase DarG n=1 Tax=Noviherbaspirillum sp. Root189 TaxID=1736487 RepID=UPI0007092543|nr:macro domain-containing protein [Noviherbaspirillum sp. Root189]KRB88445.1 Appr-1-p processing protein [Noviherbaspirillum sp. Root189]
MVELNNGNLLTAQVEALVNTVNTEGVMGKGIALQFKQAYPAMFKSYEAACKAKEVRLGRVHVYDLGGLVGGPKWIINFPTKGHWKSKSRLVDIKAGLEDLVAKVRELNIRSIAVPPLGCGFGGLSWADVEPLIMKAFAPLPDVDVKLFTPSGAPLATSMPNRTERPAMTKGRAALIAIMQRYQQGLLDPFISLLEIHKLMYFLQEAGQPLKLQYEANQFGPYAKNLRQVLIKLEGHFLQGYGDGQDSPTKPIELKEGAAEAAEPVLMEDPALVQRMSRVSTLIEGFEDPYGLELLSSVHWVMCRSIDARESPKMAIEMVHNWNNRKRAVLKADHLQRAWDRLKMQHWDTESVSALH